MLGCGYDVVDITCFISQQRAACALAESGGQGSRRYRTIAPSARNRPICVSLSYTASGCELRDSSSDTYMYTKYKIRMALIVTYGSVPIGALSARGDQIKRLDMADSGGSMYGTPQVLKLRKDS